MTTEVASLSLSRRIGNLLIQSGRVSAAQFEECFAEQKKSGGKLTSLLVSKGYIPENDLLELLSQSCGLDFVHLEGLESIPEELVAKIPDAVARQKLLIPLAIVEGRLRVAMADPLNILALDEIKMMTGFDVDVVIAPEAEIRAAIEKHYKAASASEILQDILEKTGGESGTVEEATQSKDEAGGGTIHQLGKGEEAPVVQMVNLILARAVKAKASDIHIEPYQKSLRVRYRIDGVLHEQPSPPKRYLNAIISRLKIMSALDISERRLPQDGRIKIRVEGKDVDIRLSICPCSPGEKAVMRIMDSSAMMLDIAKLGFDPENLAVYSKHIEDPHGIILVTGPTGSGKSTTLYSTLHTLNTEDANIMTAEDPVEFQLEGINQVQCNAEIGLTFAAALRSFLRQDPDIIMVGEIRDLETVTIAINAALTGHLVFSTLHTNDAPGAVTRMLMMGIDPFLVSSALTMVVAQRLVRRICAECKESYEVDTAWLASLGVQSKRLPHTPKALLQRGKGCERCAGTGYRGRLGIHEVLEATDEVRALISRRATSEEIKETGIRAGMITLKESALRKMLDGQTTAEEVIRVTGSD